MTHSASPRSRRSRRLWLSRRTPVILDPATCPSIDQFEYAACRRVTTTKDIAMWLLDRDDEPGLYMNLDPLEYFLEGERAVPTSPFNGLILPTEFMESLLQFPRALPTHLKGISA